MSFTLDTNILIKMERVYSREFFPSLWDALEKVAAAGEACICEVAHKELERGDDTLAPWAKSIPGFVCATTDVEVITVASISRDHPDWVQGPKNQADPFVIAHAKEARRTIVTEETQAGPGTIDKNQKIPNIASKHGVACIKFFDFLRIQGWRF